MQPATWTYRGPAHSSPGDTEIVLYFAGPDGRPLTIALPLADAERLQVDVAAGLYLVRQQP